MSNIRRIIVIVSMLVVPQAALAERRGECPSSGFRVGFFNGMWAKEQAAFSSLNALSLALGDTFEFEQIRYELFYNSTVSPFGDLVEVCFQRMAEQDPALAKHKELCWELLNATKELSPTLVTLSDLDPTLGILFAQIRQDLSNLSAQSLYEFASKLPTELEYEKHRKQLGERRSKTILVGHSQGNLFMNAAYDFGKDLLGETAISAIHVAPASVQLRGLYTLTDRDRIISELLRSLGPVPTANVTGMPFNLEDPFGHNLTATYLRKDSDAFSGKYGVLAHFQSSLENLAMNNVSETAGNSDFCPTNTADCDGLSINGREIDLDRDELNCGVCGQRCEASSPDSAFTGQLCFFGKCVNTRAPATLVIKVEVFGGPKTAGDFGPFISSFPPTPGSPGYPWWDSVFIPSSLTGTMVSVGQGPISVAILPRDTPITDPNPDFGGYAIGFEGDCFGFTNEGSAYECTLKLCYGGDSCL